MIVISVISRIADDKNWFLDIVYLAHFIKKHGVEKFEINFIGSINNNIIYQNIKRLAVLLEVDSKIKFSKSSIPLMNLPARLRNGYFINFVVGDFLGYSSLECIKMNFKTFLYNIDNNILEKNKYLNICNNIQELCNKILLLKKHQLTLNKILLKNNSKLNRLYYLSDNEKGILTSILNPSDD